MTQENDSNEIQQPGKPWYKNWKYWAVILGILLFSKYFGESRSGIYRNFGNDQQWEIHVKKDDFTGFLLAPGLEIRFQGYILKDDLVFQAITNNGVMQLQDNIPIRALFDDGKIILRVGGDENQIHELIRQED